MFRFPSTRVRFAILVCTALLLCPAQAWAWFADFFDPNVSGQAIYEAMSIHAEAVYRDGVTYIAYQGADLDPYMVTYDHRLPPEEQSSAWQGPFKVAENPLTGSWNPDDTHGAPALLIDQAGYLHVFYGAHGNSLRHAKSLAPLDISAFETQATVAPKSTYPQILPRSVDATHHMFYRVDGGDSSPIAYQGGWIRAESSTGDTWTAQADSELVLAADESISWYASFERGDAGRLHAVAVTLKKRQSAFAREDVFYMYRDLDGIWRDVEGSVISTEPDGVDRSELLADRVSCLVQSDDGFQNQVVVADDGSGSPGILYLSGSGYGEGSYGWMFSRWDGDEWVTTQITTTDHFMDSACLEFDETGRIKAYLVSGGSRGEGSALDPYADRGGDVELWVSDDDGAVWTREATIAASDVDREVLYNAPQLVRSDVGTVPEARLVFGEWDNDAGNMFHKVFLWGDDGYRQKEFFPDVERIGGLSRYEVSAALSRESYPIGADVVFIASGTAFADALAGVPLANSYNAPLLLTATDSLPSAVADEIRRLDPGKVVILGGPATVSEAVKGELRAITGAWVRRISGANRFEVAASIAEELADREGPPDTVVVVSGADVAAGDALSISPVAAVKRWPILFTLRDSVPMATRVVLKGFEGESVVIVGGPASVSEPVEQTLGGDLRLAGLDRYGTSAAIARFGLSGDAQNAPCLSMMRFALASGTVLSDALPGGAVLARMNGPLLLTQGGELSEATAALLETRAYRVLTAYVFGGEKTVSPETVMQMTLILQERQWD